MEFMESSLSSLESSLSSLSLRTQYTQVTQGTQRTQRNSTNPTELNELNELLIMPMRIGDTRPSFEGATEWLNERQDTADDYVTGQPTLVHFWATSCGICKENMPKLQELKAKYKDRGLKTVAIHMPRYEADTDLEKVKA